MQETSWHTSQSIAFRDSMNISKEIKQYIIQLREERIMSFNKPIRRIAIIGTGPLALVGQHYILHVDSM